MSGKPRIEIEYCTGCRWLLRAAWVAQELLSTFEDDLEAVALKPGSEGGIFEIRVDVDQERLAALNIPLERIRGIVAAANVNQPGGSLEDARNQYLIRTVNEFATVAEIRDLVISERGGRTVRLADVATVERGYRDREEITRVDGQESVEIAIYKEGDANTVQAVAAVRESLDGLTRHLPDGHEIRVLFDQSRFIERSITEVRNALLIGAGLAIAVLFFFLRDLRSTLIIATSIPLSVVATFMVMYRLGVSLNIMSLGGLTLGIGMLVDNAIVVLEAIFRRRREGLSLARAAVAGTGEVGGAVVASTLTTVAVFLPIVFVEGIAGQLFGDMALTVTFSMVASLLVAVTLIPMLSAVGSDAAAKVRARAGDGPSGGDFTLGAVSRAYDRLLRGSLRTPVFTLGVAVVLLAGSLWSTRFLGSELIPQVSEGEFFFEVTMPEGTPLEGTERAMLRMEEAVAGDARVARQFSSVGRRLVSGGLSLDTEAEHYGQVHVTLADRRDEAAEIAVAEDLRREFAAIPDLRVREGRPTYFSLATPIEVVVFGDDLVLLDEVTDGILAAIDDVPGLVDMRSSLEEGSPELQVRFDRDRLAALGLDVATLSRTLQQRVQGAVATQFKEADRQIDIRVRNAEKDRASAADVRNLVVEGPEGPIRLLTVAEVTEARGPAEIHRLQQQRCAVISANVEGRALGAVVDDLEAALRTVHLPPEVTVEIGGQNREMEVSFGSLRFAIALAIFLTYLVMAATFESLLHPFIVLFSIPLALTGVVVGLLATGTEVSVIVLIGTVMLVGIVVNNAIVLIDTVNQLRRAGADKVEAVVRAGHIRLRPILMTTLTTVLGLLPMSLAVGEGSELRAPLAITVSWGLVFSTLLTLVVIPAAYRLVPSRIQPETDQASASTGAVPAPRPSP